MQLRRYKNEDCKTLYDWRVHPTARVMFLNSEVFPYEDHEKWFKNFIADDKRLGLMLENEKQELVGHIRLWPGDFEGGMRISVAVSPEFYGKGYGTKILKMGCDNDELIKRSIFLIAEIKENNIASQRMCEKNAFVSLGNITSDGFTYFYTVRLVRKDLSLVPISVEGTSDVKKAVKKILDLVGLTYAETSKIKINAEKYENLLKDDPTQFRISIFKIISETLSTIGDK